MYGAPMQTKSAQVRTDNGNWEEGSPAHRLATLAKALAHPARIEIIRVLARRKTCIGCDIVEEIQLAQSTTSEHLRILKSANVIVGEIDRPRVCYSLNPEALSPLGEFLGELVEVSTQ